MSNPRRILLPAAAVCVAFLAGCASAPGRDPRDPMEPANRAVNSFNYNTDKVTLRPVANAYEKHVPSVVRTGVSNFFGNIGDAWSAVNHLLQLHVPQAAQSATRFAFNTVFGLGGTLDILGEAGLERNKADFGMTLARWGVPAGPYVELPLFGPSTLRDAVALPVDLAANPIRFVTPVADRNALGGTAVVDARARALPVDPMLDSALDRYTLTRDMYLQHREAQVSGGSAGAGDAQETKGIEATSD